MTGMSGAGKTTVLDELHRRGFFTIDTDYGGWVLPDGTWDEPRMGELLARHGDLVVSGTVENPRPRRCSDLRCFIQVEDRTRFGFAGRARLW